VLLEAMASGLPVAAFPVPGPLDVVTDPAAGALDENLAIAVRHALKLSPEAARNHALGYSWEVCALKFLENLHPFGIDGR
ncbi:MAG: glycosyltransferase family 1 protein, partial [Alphaproteobacteria bacterium]